MSQLSREPPRPAEGCSGWLPSYAAVTTDPLRSRCRNTRKPLKTELRIPPRARSSRWSASATSRVGVGARVLICNRQPRAARIGRIAVVHSKAVIHRIGARSAISIRKVPEAAGPPRRVAVSPLVDVGMGPEPPPAACSGSIGRVVIRDGMRVRGLRNHCERAPSHQRTSGDPPQKGPPVEAVAAHRNLHLIVPNPLTRFCTFCRRAK